MLGGRNNPRYTIINTRPNGNVVLIVRDYSDLKIPNIIIRSFAIRNARRNIGINISSLAQNGMTRPL